VAAICPPVESVAAVFDDSGFYSEAAVQTWKEPAWATHRNDRLYAAVEKKEHHRTVSDLEQKPGARGAGPEASTSDVMKYRATDGRGPSQIQNCGSRPWNRFLESSRASWDFDSFFAGSAESAVGMAVGMPGL